VGEAAQFAGTRRYQLVPRTAVFVRADGRYLLVKGAATKRIWPGMYNAIGGHVERGEDVLSSARRELLEEAGITADLWLCGIVIVDAGDSGVGLYVYVGEQPRGIVHDSAEGTSRWLTLVEIRAEPSVEDLPYLLAKIDRWRAGDAPFSARSRYDEDGHLRIEFVD